MKNKLYALLILLCWGCSPEAMEHCFTKDGNKEIRVIELEEFNSITIHNNIELRISQSETQHIQVEAGKNIIDGIEFNLKDGHLDIQTQELCAAGSTNAPYIIHLATPNLTDIRNSSQYKVISTNTLTFEKLFLISENYNAEQSLASGDFELDVSLNRLRIVHSGLSDFNITGDTNIFNIEIYSGSGRIFTDNLMANQINILHRGFGDVHVFPLESITGRLLSSGNLILHNLPPIQEIETLYIGRVLIQTE